MEFITQAVFRVLFCTAFIVKFIFNRPWVVNYPVELFDVPDDLILLTVFQVGDGFNGFENIIPPVSEFPESLFEFIFGYAATPKNPGPDIFNI